MTWVTVETRQATAEDFARPVYRFIAHQFKDKVLSWPRCRGCGLLSMRHPFAQWAIRMGCMNEYHPDHGRQCRMVPQ